TEPQTTDPIGSETPKSEKTDKTKIEIRLKANGNATNYMKKKKWAVDPDKKISSIMEFVKKNVMKGEVEKSAFLYVNQSFAPAPDQIVKNLYECYGTDGKLVLHYCKTQAWG
ncbi:hypothetical protein L9F63_004142, partial [Diploptera punctata]